MSTSPNQSNQFSYEFLDDESRLDHFLVLESSRTRSFIQEQVLSGNIQVNGKIVTKAGHRLRRGDKITGIWKIIERMALVPVDAPLEILFEDEWLLVINKRAGVVVHPAAGHREDTLVHHLLHHIPQFAGTENPRVGIVHRIDKGTTGVLLVAKTPEVQEKLMHQFKDRQVQKEYEALVWGKIGESGRFDKPMGRDRSHGKKMSSRTRKAREAVTEWKRIENLPPFSHVALFPKTGRTHQLRVHLTEAGFAIVGDPLYGKRSEERRFKTLKTEILEAVTKIDHTLLHARRLSFRHPQLGKHVSVEAPRPKDFQHILDLLR